jgi:hypothetical protein
MVHSISVSIGRMVGFLDQSPCMNQTKFDSYSNFSTTVLMSLELHSIIEECALDCTRAAIVRSNRDYVATEPKQRRKTEKIN